MLLRRNKANNYVRPEDLPAATEPHPYDFFAPPRPAPEPDPAPPCPTCGLTASPIAGGLIRGWRCSNSPHCEWSTNPTTADMGGPDAGVIIPPYMRYFAAGLITHIGHIADRALLFLVDAQDQMTVVEGVDQQDFGHLTLLRGEQAWEELRLGFLATHPQVKIANEKPPGPTVVPGLG